MSANCTELPGVSVQCITNSRQELDNQLGDSCIKSSFSCWNCIKVGSVS